MLENQILQALVFSEPFARKVFPFLKEEYFFDRVERAAFTLISDFMEEYGKPPTKDALLILAGEIERSLNDDEVSQLKSMFSVFTSPIIDHEWLVDQAEAWCQDKALYLAVHTAIEVMHGDEKSKIQKGELPQILTNALAVGFDTNVGHDYIENSDERWEHYHRTEERVPFDLDMFNKITNGGFPKKTLNVFMAGTNVGKTALMCHLAAANLAQGKNVLYITLEMSEIEIAKRVDANLLNVNMDDLIALPKDIYDKKIARIKSKSPGKIIVKEYPTSGAGVNNFRHLLNELRIKKNFIPDIVYVDYINICISSRVKLGTGVNSYTYIKSIAEELRGLAVEQNVPIVSGTQLNRTGSKSSSPDITDTSESMGLPMTADFLVVMVCNEELQQLNQILCTQLKNRYRNKTKNTSFVIGVDFDKMRLYDCEQSAHENLHGSNPPSSGNNMSTADKKSWGAGVFKDFQ